MTRISWDGTADRKQSQGVGKAVLYPKNSTAVPWNGLTSVKENGDDSPSTLYIDGQPYKNSITPSTFAGIISAYMYPDEFEPYIGVSSGIGITGQPKKSFGLSYRDNNEIHLVYNVLVSPSSDKYATMGANVDPVMFQWNFTTTPVNIPGGKPSAHLVIMVDQASPDAISNLENLIYGDDANAPVLPDPVTVYNLFDSYAFLRITDNGDGTWTANDTQGSILTMLDSVTFQINWSSAVVIDADNYKIHSL